MNQQNLIQSLEEFNLHEHQAKVYLALLELGNSTVLDISRKSGVERAHVYFILEQLIKMGLVSRSQKGRAMSFVANNPKNLAADMERKLNRIKDSLPELLAIYQDLGSKPRVQIFEGRKGLVQILKDMVETMQYVPKQKREILEYISPDSAAAAMHEEQREFIRERIANKIKIRWIAPDTELARQFVNEPKQNLREMRLVPQNLFKAETEINIYGNKINFIGSKGDPIGVIIEHPELAKTMSELFELAWLGTQKIKKSVK
jgi:sugar-specific transcriptional regulator TrmB